MHGTITVLLYFPAPGDYDAVAEVLIFSASVNRICRNVSSVDDDILEEDEDFTLTLNTTDSSVNLIPDEAIVTITDDDRMLNAQAVNLACDQDELHYCTAVFEYGKVMD